MKLNVLKSISIILLSALMIGCASSDKKETKEVKSMESHPKSISHGTVQIACTIIELKEVKGQPICVAMVDTVFGYGAGTRPIAVDSELDLSIEKSLDKDIFKKDSKLRLTLRFTNERFGGAVDYPWQIIIVKNK